MRAAPRIQMNPKNAPEDEDRGSTFDGIVAILLPFSCCLLPLLLWLLASLGSWMAVLPGFATYRPWLAGLALICCVVAWRRIYRPRTECGPGGRCAAKVLGIGAKVLYWVLVFAVWDLFGSPLLQGPV